MKVRAHKVETKLFKSNQKRRYDSDSYLYENRSDLPEKFVKILNSLVPFGDCGTI